MEPDHAGSRPAQLRDCTARSVPDPPLATVPAHGLVTFTPRSTTRAVRTVTASHEQDGSRHPRSTPTSDGRHTSVGDRRAASQPHAVTTPHPPPNRNGTTHTANGTTRAGPRRDTDRHSPPTTSEREATTRRGGRPLPQSHHHPQQRLHNQHHTHEASKLELSWVQTPQGREHETVGSAVGANLPRQSRAYFARHVLSGIPRPPRWQFPHHSRQCVHV